MTPSGYCLTQLPNGQKIFTACCINEIQTKRFHLYKSGDFKHLPVLVLASGYKTLTGALNWS